VLQDRLVITETLRDPWSPCPSDIGSQFYICVADASGLDRTYTVFGEVFRGMEVVDKIVAAARDEFDNPLKPIAMKMTVKE